MKRLFGLLLIAIISSSYSAVALDGTDTQPPTFSATVLSRGDNPDGMFVISIQVTDDKNGVALFSNGEFLNNFGIQETSKPQGIAPVCIPTQVATVSYFYASNDGVSIKKYGSNSRVFNLYFKPDLPISLPIGCPEWRNNLNNLSLKGISLHFSINDEAGNRSQINLDLSQLLGDFIYNGATKNQLCFSSSTNMAGFAQDAGSLNDAYNAFKTEWPNFKDIPTFAELTSLKFYEYFIAIEKYMDLQQGKIYKYNDVTKLPLCSIKIEDIELSSILQKSFLALRELNKLAEADAAAKGRELKAKQEAEAKAKAAAEKANAEKFASKKPTTIYCAKGKITKTVTGINPKCPTGYKKK